MIRRVTSQPLGSLPPGYAATKQGYASYVALVGDLGLIALGIGYAQVFLIIGSIGVFIIVSIAVIAGEVVTYRMLKR
ncbi:MAG TPA: hypothetical protein VGV88_00580 [Candidatus Dormibacteraeota bacterium]|nr:hypothetical protein [Candidatus Dormibacteraeota bacterium]